ncbi:MAG: hypothetical protein J6Y37_08025 [Paludibacteraceae bacterium]|nr:hypothetical protein [Paludibacteraceae bacterium]
MKNFFRLGGLLSLLFLLCSGCMGGRNVSTERPQVTGELDSIRTLGQYGWYSAYLPFGPRVYSSFDMKTGEGRIRLTDHPLDWSINWKTRVTECGDTIKLELFSSDTLDSSKHGGPRYYDISTKLVGVQAKRYVVSVLLPQEGYFHYSYSFVMDLRDGVEGKYHDVDGMRRVVCFPDLYDCLDALPFSKPDLPSDFFPEGKSSCH